MQATAAPAQASGAAPAQASGAASAQASDQAPAQPSDAASTQAPTAPPTHAAPPSPNHLAGDLYALIVHLHKNCNSDLFAAVGALELSLTQIKLLHHLEAADQDLSLKRAAELVQVSLPAASRMVDDLLRRGFVEREEDVEDRRMKRVRPTDDGRAVIRRLNAARLSGLGQFVDGLTDEERATVATALKTLLARPEIAACRPDQELAASGPLEPGRSDQQAAATPPAEELPR